MATKTKTSIILSIVFSIPLAIILQFPYKVAAEDSCAYPCYPPPTGTGGTPTTPVTTTPPSSQWGGSNSPPLFNYPPPSGYLPFIPPPPFGGGSFVPPPPDPILPYFPFYFKKPLHQDTSSSSLGGTGVMVSVTCFVAFAMFNLFLR